MPVPAYIMNIPAGLLNAEQERELDKVNAFYLQKEAEVCTPSPHWGFRCYDVGA